eukprot:s1632_g4.t1
MSCYAYDEGSRSSSDRAEERSYLSCPDIAQCFNTDSTKKMVDYAWRPVTDAKLLGFLSTKKMVDYAWRPVTDAKLLGFLGSVACKKRGWFPYENGHALGTTCFLEEEEAEVLVSLFLPEKAAYKAAYKVESLSELSPELVDQLLEHFVDPVHGSPSKGRKTVGLMSLHVDDLIISGTPEFLTWFLKKIKEHVTVGYEDKSDLTFTGQRVRWVMDAQGNKKYISIDQKLCVSELEEIVIPKHLKDADVCDKALHTSYRSLLGSNWLQSRAQFQACYQFSRLASASASPTVGHCKELNKLCRQIRSEEVEWRVWPVKGSPRILGIPDAACRNNSDKSSQRAMTIFIADERVKNRRDTRGSLVFFESTKIKRTTLSTTVAELYALMKCFGTCQMLRGLWEDISGSDAEIHMRTDANNLAPVASMKLKPEGVPRHLGQQDVSAYFPHGETAVTEILEGQLAFLQHVHLCEENHRGTHILKPRLLWKYEFLCCFLGCLSSTDLEGLTQEIDDISRLRHNYSSWSVRKFFAFLMANSKGRFSLWVAPKALVFDRFFDWDFDISHGHRIKPTSSVVDDYDDISDEDMDPSPTNPLDSVDRYEPHKWCDLNGGTILVVRFLSMKRSSMYRIQGSSRNTLKVTDFGLATIFQPGVPLTSTAGTPSHMAPEVYAKKYNLACDLWSCGVILFFVVSRLMPFDANEKGSKRFKFNLNVHPWDLIHQDRLIQACWARFQAFVFGFRGFEPFEDCINLVTVLLDKSVHKRATAAAALRHPWIVNNTPRVEDVVIQPNILAQLKRYRKHNRFKRACFNVAASFLKESERATSDCLFQFLDSSGDGRILFEDLRAFSWAVCCCLEMAKLVGEKDAREIFGAPDPVDNTYKPFPYTEFLAATFDRKHGLTTAVCKTAFAAFDRNSDGTISMAELTSGRLLGALTVEEISETLKQLDKKLGCSLLAVYGALSALEAGAKPPRACSRLGTAPAIGREAEAASEAKSQSFGSCSSLPAPAVTSDATVRAHPDSRLGRLVEIQAPAICFRDGALEAVGVAEGGDRISSLVNAAAKTCSSVDGTFQAWRLTKLEIHLASFGVRRHFETTVEEASLHYVQAEGHGPESRDEELDVRSFDFGSNLGSSDERDQSWSKIDDHGREEREWYREAAEAAPGPQDCEETRPCRSQQRSQRAPGPYAAPAVHPAVAQSLFEEKRKSPMKFPWEVGFGKVVFQKESYGHLRFPFELPLVSCQNDVIGAFGSRRKLGAFAPLPC